MPSSSSTEADATVEPGVELAGFRIERLIGRGSVGAVYEATQISLDRRVALRVIPPEADLGDRFRGTSWPEHVNVVSTYAVGSCEYGQFIAMYLVHGSTLAEALPVGRPDPRQVLDVLRKVAAGLDGAHAAGIVHGSLSARDVLIDRDRAVLVADFGLGPPGATAATDRDAFVSLVAESLRVDLPALAYESASAADVVELAAGLMPPPSHRGRRILATLAVGAAAAGAIVGTGSDSTEESPPAVIDGAMTLGSDLTRTGVTSVDCEGGRPDSASPACTVVQTELDGRPVVAARDGAIRRWTVRGARGELALRVLRPRGESVVFVARTPYQVIPDERVHVMPANLGVRKGDLVGLEVTPGATVGVRNGVAGASTTRWFGVRDAAAVSVLRLPGDAGVGRDRELVLRVEYIPGARPTVPGMLAGTAAEFAPAGVRLAEQDVDIGPGRTRTVAVTLRGNQVALDLFAGGRRLLVLPVPDVDERGRVFDLHAFGRPLVRLQWLNPDGRTTTHDYVVRSRSLSPVS